MKRLIRVGSSQTTYSCPLFVLVLYIFTLKRLSISHEVVMLLFGPDFGLSRAHYTVRLTLDLLTDLRKIERTVLSHLVMAVVVVLVGVARLRLVHTTSLRRYPFLPTHRQNMRPTTSIRTPRISDHHLRTLQLNIGFIDKMLLHFIF